MKTNSPSHEEVSHRAQEIWKARGRPHGCDTEIWLEAERELSGTGSGQKSPSDPQVRGAGNSQRSVTAGDPKPTDATPDGTAAKAAQQTKAARAPKLPRKGAPKSSPAETGKPLWDKPHSS